MKSRPMNVIYAQNTKAQDGDKKHDQNQAINNSSFMNGNLINAQNLSSQTPLTKPKSTLKVIRQYARPITAIGQTIRIPNKQGVHKLQSKGGILKLQDQGDYNELLLKQQPHLASEIGSKKHSIFVAKRYSEQAILEAAIQDNSTQASKQDTQSVSNQTRFKVNSRALKSKKKNYNSTTLDPADDYFKRSRFSKDNKKNSSQYIAPFNYNTQSNKQLEQGQQYIKRHILGSVDAYQESDQRLKAKVPNQLFQIVQASKQMSASTDFDRRTSENSKEQQFESKTLLTRLSNVFEKKIQGYAKKAVCNSTDRRKTIIVKQSIPVKEQELEQIIEKIDDRVYENKVKEYCKLSQKPHSEQLQQSRNQRVMEGFEKVVLNWGKQVECASRQLNKDKNQTLLSQSDQYRKKAEVKNLLDKGQTLREKYGERGWKMNLRYNENFNDGLLEYKEVVGPLHQGISSQVRDERKKPIELVRRSEFLTSTAKGQQQNQGIEINNQKDPQYHCQHINLFNISQSVNNSQQFPRRNDDSNLKFLNRPQTASSNYQSIKQNSLIQQKFKYQEKLLNQLIPSQSSDKDLAGLIVEGQNVLEKEKEALRILKLRKQAAREQNQKGPLMNGILSQFKHSILKNVSKQDDDDVLYWQKNDDEVMIQEEEIICEDYR